MALRRKRDVGYVRLSKGPDGFMLTVKAEHLESLQRFLIEKSITFRSEASGNGKDNWVSFAGVDAAHLKGVIREWKDAFASGH